MMRILQINVSGGIVAQSLALRTAAEQSVDLLIMSDFYKYGNAYRDWHCDRSNRAAIVPLSNLPIDEIGGSGYDGFVWVTIGDVRFYSYY